MVDGEGTVEHCTGKHFPLLPNEQFPKRQQIPGLLLLNSIRDTTDKDYVLCLLAAKM